MPANDAILQSHHVIEQSVFRDHDLLKKLVEHGLIDEHTSANRLYLPVDGGLADALETSPHRGRTRSSYTKGIRQELDSIADTGDGVAALADDPAALRRVNARVAELQDTLKVALVNGDALATTPDSLTKDQANARNNRTFSDLDHYRATHADQLKALRSMGSVESEWAAVTHSEHRIVRVIDAARATGSNLVAAPYEPAVREIVGREEFRLAIAHAQDAGRVTLSESNAALIQQVLDDTPTAIGGAARGIRQVAGASPPPYTPLSQRGFATAELLAGDLSAGQALRSAGLLVTAADAVTSGQRSVRFLGQDKPLAAQSELAPFAGRNAGGWAGGTAAAYALGSSGAGPMVLIAADAYFMSVAGEKAAALLDNRAIYHQTDRDGTAWSFDGRAWSRGGMADTTGDGIDNPAAMPIVASYAKSRELNYHATNAAAALALKDAPAPTDPYRQPANAGDRPSLNAADWRRDTADGQWHRLVKTEISGANDRGGYEQETASPPRAAELDAQAQAVIAHNIANSPGAIAARYELTYHRSGWAAEGLPMSPAVQQALPDPDALIASNGQRYYRNMEGQWTGQGAPPDANRVLELETTRAMLQPALAEQAQAIATIQQSPPSPQDVQREQTLYQYRIVGTELQPQWQEAIELATQRTREAEGLAGDGAMQLQRGPGGQYGADSPITHLQRGPDGVERIAAVTSTEDIRQALREVQARQHSAVPMQQVASAQRPSEGSADTDTSDASPSNQHALDVQARGQAANAAQERQERQQEDRQAQEQHLAQVRAHALQEQASHDDRAQAAAALQAHAVSELRQQESQQLQQLQQQEQHQQRQALDAQQGEQREQQAAHDARQQETLDR
ncbi:A nuclease family of the HNH/ENDO VII superfamily with conserved AHH [Xanthomonas citri subsp. citri UI6]|nr:A nuclease family of the HNH/ENDO VII superfamily with conserved AHH [Xanthomonas citri subsp. citri UI6]